ncbi:hypothetical protein MBLNU230_g1357t1 [Neophaeotheca triangularis]
MDNETHLAWKNPTKSWTSSNWFRFGLPAALLSILILLAASWNLKDYKSKHANDAASTLIDLPPFALAPTAPTSSDDLSAGNATLGFTSIVALSRGTKWRVEGLQAAANYSQLALQIPTQPGWSSPFIEAFENFGPHAHGAAMAWLAHIDLLKLIIGNRWPSALVLEDDMDWSADIRTQTPQLASAVLNLTQQPAHPSAPYGLAWDVLWLGHCGDPPHLDAPHILYNDSTAADIHTWRGGDKWIKTQLNSSQRAVHFSNSPVCTFAYGVTAQGAKNVLAIAAEGKGGAFDLMLMNACKNKALRCVTVNPEIFDPYHPAEGEESEVGAGDHGEEFKSKSSNLRKGHTDNVMRSARCLALFGETCFNGE